MKGLIFGSALFVGGIISITILIASQVYVNNFHPYFLLLLMFAIVGFVMMVIGLFSAKTVKKALESKYDITGKLK